VPQFRYSAIAESGDLVEGTMEARSREAVLERLIGSGHMPIEAEADRQGGGGGLLSRLSLRGAKSQDVTLFTRELAMLLAAGLTLERALEVLSAEMDSGGIARVIADLLADVRSGKSFNEALGKRPRVFPPVYVKMISAAESSGTLEPVLERLADYRERSEKLREKIVGALLYPAILVVASIGAVLLLLAFVVPQFEEVFANAGAALPVSTQIVIGAARALENYGLYAGIALAVLVLGFLQLLQRPAVRYWLDSRLLAAPLLGGRLRMLIATRLCRTLGTLLANGVDLPLALVLTRDVLQNGPAAEALDRVIDAVRSGRGMAEPLNEASILPSMAIQMLRVGEETGRLWPSALHVADLYERKLETSLQRLFVILEPALVMSVGVLVGGIIVSILLAVVSVNDLAF